MRAAWLADGWVDLLAARVVCFGLLTCLSLTWLLGYLVTWLLGYLVTWLLGYFVLFGMGARLLSPVA